MEVPPDERRDGDRERLDLRPFGLALAVVAMLGIVALASRGRVPGGGGGTKGVDRNLLIEYAFLFFLVLAAAIVPLFAHTLWHAKKYSGSKPLKQRKWMGRTLIWMAALALLASALLIMRSRHERREAGRVGTATIPTTTATTTAKQRNREIAFDWLPVFVVSGLVISAVGAGVLLQRHNKRRRPKTADEIARELSDVLDDTLDDLRDDPDARRAVIRAYARMERALAWFGVPRRAHEAPLEYLARVLVDLHASADSVTRLTDLFERAKFSQHAIGAELKADAVDALETVRDELRGYR